MPYLVINDRGDVTHYYAGQGYRIGVDTVVEEYAALRFPDLRSANAHLRGKAKLYGVGWRIVPVEK